MESIYEVQTLHKIIYFQQVFALIYLKLKNYMKISNTCLKNSFLENYFTESKNTKSVLPAYLI